MFTSATLSALIASASAGTILWDGRANGYNTSAFLDSWSFSNPVGPYQYYIHGNGSTTDYVNLSPDYKNPADTSSAQGLQITIDGTSSWHNQTMMRTELIPQTSAAINSSKVFYHFSIQHTATHPPTQNEEHQVCFFESHFTELKYGVNGGSSNELQWFVDGESQWSAAFEAGVWHNVAYGIDFDAGTVAFYHSTGAEDLQLIAGPVAANTSSNGADWHLGVLRLPGDGVEPTTEDWHFSGVYIESEEVTLTVVGPSNGTNSPAMLAKAAASRMTSTTPLPTTFQTQTRGASMGVSTVGSTTIPPYYGNATSAPFSDSTSMARNLAATFSATVSIPLTFAPNGRPPWYTETAAPSAMDGDC